MSNLNHELFADIVETSKKDETILSLILSGSRGKGLETKYSDYDILLIVKNNCNDEHKLFLKKYNSNPGIDLDVKTLDEFMEYAEISTEFEWDRYNFAHNTAIIDKTSGEIQAIINEKGKIPQKHLQNFISGHLDGYINAIYRSFKAIRDDYYLAYRLEAIESITLFFRCVFAIHDRRLNPFSKYLEFELLNYPLYKLPWNSKEILEKVTTIINTGDYKIQKELFLAMEELMRKEGYGQIFDGWSDNLKWIIEFNI